MSYVRGLASFARVLLFDRRGSGISDRGSANAGTDTIEARMDDIRAVMDAAGSERASLLGSDSGAALCITFAATYPHRCVALILVAAAVRGLWAPDYPWGWTEAEWADWHERVEREWGSPEFTRMMVEWTSPSLANDEAFVRARGSHLRLSGSPGDAIVRDAVVRDTDVRHVLPSIQVPTLVIHRTGDKVEPVEEGRYIANQIPGANFLELPGEDHAVVLDDLVPHVGRFVETVRASEAVFDRVLATVLFTDIVGSTEHANELGDRLWRELLDRHRSIVRAIVGRFRGKEIETAGDGFLATFDGPARGISAALMAVQAVRPLGIEIRAGLHTGEIETLGDKVAGIAVHIGARVGSLAGASEVLVSQTVKDLVAGSGLRFEDAGEHDLKGVPDEWRLYRVVSELNV